MKKDGIVANVVFGAKGERKQMGVCALFWLFIFNLIGLLCSTAFWLLARLVLAVPMLFIGQRPDFGWVVPSKWAANDTALSQTYLNDEWRAMRNNVLEMVVMVAVIIIGGAFVLFIAAALLTILGDIATGWTGLQLTVIGQYFGEDPLLFALLHGLFIVVSIALIAGICFLGSILGFGEVAELTGDWLVAKKDNICPIVSFE